MDTNTVNIRSVSIWQCWYVLSNTESTLDPQFIRKLSNTEAELKKSVAYKKSMLLIEISQSYRRLFGINTIFLD